MVFHGGVAPFVGDDDEVKHGVLRRRWVGLLLSLCSELGKPRVSDVCTTGRGVERSRWCGSAGPYGGGNDRRTAVVSSSSGEIRFALAHACGNRRRGKVSWEGTVSTRGWTRLELALGCACGATGLCPAREGRTGARVGPAVSGWSDAGRASGVPLRCGLGGLRPCGGWAAGSAGWLAGRLVFFYTQL